MSRLYAIILVISLAAISVLGDYFLKLASREERALWNAWFPLGVVLYAGGAFGWVFAMRHLKLATIGVVFSLSTVLLLALIGAMAFGERLDRHEVAGCGFAVLALVLLARLDS